MTAFDKLGLRAELTRAVAEEGYTEPTPVQIHAIPVILEGRDVLAGAQTGTGKTAGFTLPMLQRLLATGNDKGGRRHIRALILTPTRELAAQVEESVRIYGKYVPLRSTLIYGGVSINPQIEALQRGVDILVATPGRLLDHVGQRTVDLSRVEILVLDEADRMLDMGFIRDIRKILALLPQRRQNLLFSATFSEEIRSLANGVLHNPASVEVARRNAESELVSQRVHPVDASRKRDLLAHLISSGNWQQVLVFTRTKHGANRLAAQLIRAGIEAAAIHGNKSQGARTRALADFKANRVRVLVATDIAARGLDIEQLPHVVNYELPNVPEDYVHRIGRTGRAGCEGEAVALVSADERAYLADIEKLLRKKLEQQVIPGFEPGTGSARVADERDERDARDGRSGRGGRSPGRGSSSHSERGGDRGRGSNRSRPPQRSEAPRGEGRETSRPSQPSFGSGHASAAAEHRSGSAPSQRPPSTPAPARPAAPASAISKARRALVPPPAKSIRYMP